MINKIIHWLIMPCCQATLYIEKQNSQELSWWQKQRLKKHLWLCKCCENYYQKVTFLDNILKKMTQNSSSNELNDTDIQDFKNKIKNKLKI
ncbi:hypothetical protein [Myroides phaeus]|uniref:Zinc-finger n=1 Tax=Myroides phaeus TaxID=702745 RepID=A0A1G8DH66_9FLAO|nr:hypothetical protein [Myroides phaeus]SDH56974.1 hypothetical protein SAMN05421818_10712 [Myroides phaeus]